MSTGAHRFYLVTDYYLIIQRYYIYVVFPTILYLCDVTQQYKNQPNNPLSLSIDYAVFNIFMRTVFFDYENISITNNSLIETIKLCPSL